MRRLVLLIPRLLLAIPCLLWGMVIGVIGIGPDGFVSLECRGIGLCVLFGGIGLGYPFSFVPLRGFKKWGVAACIAALSALPFCLLLIALNDKEARKDPTYRIISGAYLFGVVLTVGDLLLPKRPYVDGQTNRRHDV
jgi:hypothetical protein